MENEPFWVVVIPPVAEGSSLMAPIAQGELGLVHSTSFFMLTLAVMEFA